MNNSKNDIQRELYDKLYKAFTTIHELSLKPTANFIVISPKIIEGICEIRNVTEEEAMIILEQILNQHNI